MITNSSSTCQECPAWYRDNPVQHMGVCRAYPPKALPPAKGKSTSIWPITSEDQWCYYGRTITMTGSVQ